MGDYLDDIADILSDIQAAKLSQILRLIKLLPDKQI